MRKSTKKERLESSGTVFPPEAGKNFQQSRLRADRFAAGVISLGGYMIILSVLAILVFLVYQSIPLFRGEAIKKRTVTSELNSKAPTVLTGVDPYQELYYTLNSLGDIQYGHLKTPFPLSANSLGLARGEKILLAVKGNLQTEIFSVATSKNRFVTAEIKMEPVYSGDSRKIVPQFEKVDEWSIAGDEIQEPAPVIFLSFSRNEDGLLTWVWVDSTGRVYLRKLDPDFGENQVAGIPLPANTAFPSAIAIDPDGENLALATGKGDILWFDVSDAEDIELKDQIHAGNDRITALRYLIGGGTIVTGDTKGELASYFPVRTPGNLFKLTRIHIFRPMKSSIRKIYPSPRNRLFLALDSKGQMQLSFSTSGKTELDFQVSDQAVSALDIAPKSDGILIVNNKNRVGFWSLRSAYPAATLKTLFGKVWYEGYPKPEFVWQSTGGSNEFESKLSIIPLIFGTLKGTLYAMLFSIPLAILAAIYVSQFAPKKLARVVKPTVEIMAALPSVVIGMLAGLYFSPLFEKHLMSLFMLMVVSPLVFFGGVFLWRSLSRRFQLRAGTGTELFFALGMGLASIVLALWFKTPVEKILFGGDIQQWLNQSLGLVYDTRNSIVVGFALGFAVIPIIFTMSEDALSNVPDSLSSAALALGASKWQTVRKVVLPAAASGIFAGIMLGLGRAIGETMIVLMATGNTPLMDLSPFNGFRAMSANIAVEMPEAPVGGTLFHVLFLTALLLFAFTFILNTASSVIGDRLRKKYARF